MSAPNNTVSNCGVTGRDVSPVDPPFGAEGATSAPLFPAEVLELLIDAWTVILAHETDHENQRTAMRRQRELIGMRSTERVREMEKERGLRA